MNDIVVLDDRGVVEVSGPDAGELLQRLLTNDVLGLSAGEARYAALLSPQGKIVTDMIVMADDGEGGRRFLLDCPRSLAGDLARKLAIYRLRAQVSIADRSDTLAVAAAWPARPDGPGLVVTDPRAEALGFRVVAPRADLPRDARISDSHRDRALRIAAGVPDGGTDFSYGDTFPHEANLDRLHGIDFAKGCYVGQEVVSRVEHRGTARKRVTPVLFEGEPPPPGSDIVVGEIVIGTMGSAAGGRGLALVRTDRATEAAALGAPAHAAGVHLSIVAA